MADTQLRNLDQLFERRVFRVPDYQRGYAWSKRQLDDFWDDLTNLDQKRKHYTGVLTLERIAADRVSPDSWMEDHWIIQKGFTPYYIVDGQQRLTTLIILIQAIAERMKQLGDDIALNYNTRGDIITHYIFNEQPGGVCKTYLFGYERDNPSYEYLKDKILGQFSSSNQNIETLYTHNLQAAKDYFIQRIGTMLRDELETIFRKSTLQMLFNCYEIEDDLDVFIAFETINNRGKPLSILELLKNRLIYLSTLLMCDEEDKITLRKMVNDCWKTIYEYLGKNKDDPLDDDDFLRDHWIMYFEDVSRKEAGGVSNSLLNREFTAKKVLNGDMGLEYIYEYVQNLQESVKVWYYLFNPSQSNYPNEIKIGLDRLNRLNYRAFTPLVLASFVKKGIANSENDKATMFEEMELFIFKVFGLSQRRSDTGSAAFHRMARELFYGTKSISSINSEIHEWTNDYFDLDRFKEYIRDKFRIEDKNGYYAWTLLRYFLYEYELFNMKHMNGSLPKMTWEEFNQYKKGFETIEHIYPITSDKPEWQNNFKLYSSTKQNYLKNSIGNLLALSRQKNSSLNNDSFDDKKRKIRDDGSEWGYFNGSYSEMIVAQETEWTPRQIYERGLIMISFLADRWNIIMNEDDMTQLLCLDFISK